MGQLCPDTVTSIATFATKTGVPLVKRLNDIKEKEHTKRLPSATTPQQPPKTSKAQFQNARTNKR